LDSRSLDQGSTQLVVRKGNVESGFEQAWVGDLSSRQSVVCGRQLVSAAIEFTDRCENRIDGSLAISKIAVDEGKIVVGVSQELSGTSFDESVACPRRNFECPLRVSKSAKHDGRARARRDGRLGTVHPPQTWCALLQGWRRPL
jgi:hypothetical protein